MGIAASRSLDEGGPEAGQLLHAVKKGDHMKALRLLRAMPESAASIPQSAKATAVHAAVKRGYVNILQFFGELPGDSFRGSAGTAIYQGASLGSPNGSLAPGWTSRRQTASLRPSSRFSQQNYSVHDAHGADLGSRNSVGRDSWLNAVDRHGRSPLFTAVRYNRLEFVEGLVSLGADPWASDRVTRGTALHLAATLGHAPLVAALLSSSAGGPGQRVALYDVQDMYGFTPLHYAAAAGHADVARVLLDAGASYTAASHVLYDPSPGLRHLSSLTHVASCAGFGLGLLGGGVEGGGGNDGGGGRGGLSVPCAPRSNPLHLAALRGDGVMATLLLQRFLVDTDGLTRVALERVTDPRTQLNKDGFQPYMLAGNAGHWHVAQLLIPHSRDERHHLTRNRDRDFLIFFPLPDPTAASSGSGPVGGTAAGGGEGPPPLAELAARVWAAKLLADVRSAEAFLRQLQHSHSYNNLTASPVSMGASGGSGGGGNVAASAFRDSSRSGGNGGGVFGVLLRRSGRCPAGSSPGTSAAAAVLGGNSSSHKGPSTAAASSAVAAAAAATATTSAVAAATAMAATAAAGLVAAANAPAGGSCLLAGASPGASAASTPRTSVSGACGAAGACRGVSPPRRSQLLHAPLTPWESRRATSLDLLPTRSPGRGPAEAAMSPPSQSPPRRPLPPAAAAVVGSPPGSPVVPAQGPATSSWAVVTAAAPPASPPPQATCDVCFEAPPELRLRPCPHLMCASCCRRVIEMHCAGVTHGIGAAAAASTRALGRRPAAVPPRCPFCQATIRGFVPAMVAPAAVPASATFLRQ